MKTEKLIFEVADTNQNREDGKSYIPITFHKNYGHIGGNVFHENRDSTRLQELSLVKNTYFGTIHYNIRLDMKLDNTFSRLFQEMSFSELETLHHLCE